MTSAASSADAQRSSSSPLSQRQHKPRVFADRDARRLQLLQQQKQARRDFTNQARAIIQFRSSTAAEENERAEHDATDGMDEEDPQPLPSQLQPQQQQLEAGEQQVEEEDDSLQQHHRLSSSSSSFSHSSWASRRVDYAAQFQLPQWMDALPSDLADNVRPAANASAQLRHHPHLRAAADADALLRAASLCCISGCCCHGLRAVAASSSHIGIALSLASATA